MMGRVRWALRGVGHTMVITLALAMAVLIASSLPAWLGLAGIFFPEPNTVELAGALTRFVLGLGCLFLIAGIGRVME